MLPELEPRHLAWGETPLEVGPLLPPVLLRARDAQVPLSREVKEEGRARQITRLVWRDCEGEELFPRREHEVGGAPRGVVHCPEDVERGALRLGDDAQEVGQIGEIYCRREDGECAACEGEEVVWDSGIVKVGEWTARFRPDALAQACQDRPSASLPTRHTFTHSPMTADHCQASHHPARLRPAPAQSSCSRSAPPVS